MHGHDVLAPQIRALPELDGHVERRGGPGDWCAVGPGVEHEARFEHDTAAIEFWFTHEKRNA